MRNGKRTRHGDGCRVKYFWFRFSSLSLSLDGLTEQWPSHVASTLNVSANLFICNDTGFEIALPNNKLLSAVVASQHQHFASICFL